MTYLRKIVLAIDQLINTLFGGWPDESLSAHSYRLYINDTSDWPRVIINLLFFWQKDHCYSAYHNEKKLKHFSPEYRTKENTKLD